MREIQRFEVSLKAFIVRERQVLLLREADTGFWELPGGRIDVGEEMVPPAIVLEREIGEELGPQFHIEPTDTTTTWVRRRPIDGVYQFLLARLCRHRAGELRLSPEHDEARWVGAGGWDALTLPPDSQYAEGLARLARLADL